MIKAAKKIVVDEAHWRMGRLIKMRLPWLMVGLVIGMAGSILMAQFEKLLSQNISLAFFVPIIVYMSDAVGTQTETIFVRDLAGKKVHFGKYLAKEIILGGYMGLVLGTGIGLLAWWWLGQIKVALTVGIAMAINVTVAPIVALVVAEVLFKRRADPAVGAGPFTTVVQDVFSLMVYLLTASVVMWGII